jgi:hypothetical protein
VCAGRGILTAKLESFATGRLKACRYGFGRPAIGMRQIREAATPGIACCFE